MNPAQASHECRLMLNMTRDMLNGRNGDIQSLRQLRKWMLFDGKEDWAELLKNVTAYDIEMHSEFRRALSIGQIESKLWMIEMLSGLLPRDRAYRFTVVGGWLGIFAYLLNKLYPELLERVQQIDLEPSANRIAERLNESLGEKFHALDKNALDHDYDDNPEVIINTSCEHFTQVELTMWLKSLPANRIVALQSNNFWAEPGHVNCQKNVFDFRKSVELNTYLFTGEFEFEKYRRFMVIGTTKGL